MPYYCIKKIYVLRDRVKWPADHENLFWIAYPLGIVGLMDRSVSSGCKKGRLYRKNIQCILKFDVFYGAA